MSGGGSRGRQGRLANTPRFPQSRLAIALLLLGVSPAGRQSAQVPQLLRGGLAEEGLGEVLGKRGGYGCGFVRKH